MPNISRLIFMRPRSVLLLLFYVLCAAVLLSAGIGAVDIPPRTVLSLITKPPFTDAWMHIPPLQTQQAIILWEIRLPRLALAILTGASLAVAGSAMQALLRNPLAEPSLVGVSAGAALFTSAGIVLGGYKLTVLQDAMGELALPTLAFSGSLLVSILIYKISSHQRKTSMTLMLLAGIAINSLCVAFIGLLTFIANDAQIRTLTFWSLGSLGSATWSTVGITACLSIIGIIVLLRKAGALNALALGESQAGLLGISISRLNRTCIVCIALSVGAVVSMTGIISFVGLVAPHIVRMTLGPDQRLVMPASAIVGAILVVCADLIARTVVAPTEIPIGIITTLIGVPFFLLLLFRMRQHIQL